jgi:hypothetical protein
VNKDELDELLHACAAKLAEHVDTVRIFVTAYDGSKKQEIGRSIGVGSIYAQVGHIKEWVIQMDEEARSQSKQFD